MDRAMARQGVQHETHRLRASCLVAIEPAFRWYQPHGFDSLEPSLLRWVRKAIMAAVSDGSSVQPN